MSLVVRKMTEMGYFNSTGSLLLMELGDGNSVQYFFIVNIFSAADNFISEYRHSC